MSQVITDPRKNSGCDYHRVQLPMRHIGPVNPKTPVLFVNRDTTWSVARIKAFKADGGRLVLDHDDAVCLPLHHPLASHYASGPVQQRLADLFGLADVVTVTTKRLAQELRHRTKASIEVLPNALPFDRDQFTRSTTMHADRPIVWAGGGSHHVDLELVRNVIDGRHFAMAGYQRAPVWFNMVQLFPGCRVKESLPVKYYMNHYDGHRIAIAPLLSDPFAECKSNLKILEAGAKGLPIVCSATLPYQTADMRKVVRFARDHATWSDHLWSLLQHPDKCEDEGAALAEHVRANYHLDTVNVHRRQILEG